MSGAGDAWPDFAAFLAERGHGVRVVTMGDTPPAVRPVPVDWVSRRLPFPVRYTLVAAKARSLARQADIVYATATYAAAAAAATAARRPLVAKLVSDLPSSEPGGTASSGERSRSSSTLHPPASPPSGG